MFLKQVFATFVVLASTTLALAWGDGTPVLAGPLTPHCLNKVNFATQLRGVGKNVTIAGVPTYVSEPPASSDPIKKVILFYSDVYSPFNVNNQLVQDTLASHGFHVLGIDYFFGDPIDAHQGEPGFNQTAWMAKSQEQAEKALPPWLAAVRSSYGTGPNVKYSAIGYCFGAPYAMRAGAGNDVVATAFAHPAFLSEGHFTNLTKPLLLSCAETDATFSTAALRRAADILAQRKAKYHLQIFSGVTHGFATRADPADENAVWAKDESARSVVEFFNRFSK